MLLQRNTGSHGNIWVCGEVLIDRLPSPAVGDEDRINIVGGGAANTARCVSRLGYGVQFINGLSNDEYGVLAKNKLLKDNVGLDLCLHDIEKPTCLATVSFDEEKKASYEFLIDGTATFDFNKRWLPDFGQYQPSALHLGTLATIVEPGANEIFEWAAQGAIHHDVPIIFDPNIRPTVLPDRGSYQEAVEKFAEISSVIKASDEDIEWLYPNIPIEDVATKWLEANRTSLVVITKGEDGIMSLTSDGDVIHEAPAKAIKVKDTVGAGDTVGAIFTEGIIRYGVSELVANLEFLRSVMSRANKASGITCSREGCDPPTRQDLESA